MVWAPSASGWFREAPKIGQIGLGLAGGQKCYEMIILKKEIIIDLEPARTGEFRVLGPVGFIRKSIKSASALPAARSAPK